MTLAKLQDVGLQGGQSGLLLGRGEVPLMLGDFQIDQEIEEISTHLAEVSEQLILKVGFRAEAKF